MIFFFCRNDTKLPFPGQVRVINPTNGEFSIIVVNNQTQFKPQQNSCVCHQQIMVDNRHKKRRFGICFSTCLIGWLFDLQSKMANMVEHSITGKFQQLM